MQDIDISQAVSPDNIMPCAICFHIPKVSVHHCALNGQDGYRLMCRCHCGTHVSASREAVIEYWNRNQNYEGAEWARNFARRIERECYPDREC